MRLISCRVAGATTFFACADSEQTRLEPLDVMGDAPWLEGGRGLLPMGGAVRIHEHENHGPVASTSAYEDLPSHASHRVSEDHWFCETKLSSEGDLLQGMKFSRFPSDRASSLRQSFLPTIFFPGRASIGCPAPGKDAATSHAVRLLDRWKRRGTVE